MPTEQCVNIIALDLKLIEDKLVHEVVVRTVNDLGRLAVLRDPAAVNDENAVGQRERLLRVVGNDDGRQVIFTGNGLDALLDGFLDDAVKCAQRLVQQQDARLHHRRI